MIMRAVFTHQPAPPMPPAEIIGFFKWLHLAAAVLNLLSGLYLRTGKYWTFPIVIAIKRHFFS